MIDEDSLTRDKFHPFTLDYDPLKCGSIDGTDTEPHDKAIVRAQSANFVPSKDLTNCDENTVIVSRLSRDTVEDVIFKHFSKYGKIKSLRLVRNIVTGTSQCYGFVEYLIKEDAICAYERGHKTLIDGREIIVDYEFQRSMAGWVPRRLGGGFGGKKESGQLRFGCRERPFQKPYSVIQEESSRSVSNLPRRHYQERGRERDQKRRSISPHRHRSSSYRRHSGSRKHYSRRYDDY